jgi:hypothetical protein
MLTQFFVHISTLTRLDDISPEVLNQFAALLDDRRTFKRGDKSRVLDRVDHLCKVLYACDSIESLWIRMNDSNDPAQYYSRSADSSDYSCEVD